MTENERLTNSDKEIPTLNDNAEYWLQVYFKLKDYEAIGTIEEFKALKEKSVAKKPIFDKSIFKCPFCGSLNIEENSEALCPDKYEYCPDCGQKIEWKK